MNSLIRWKQGMGFEADLDGHKVMMDAMPEHGGDNRGASPKRLFLTSMLGCTAMDVVSLMKKMRVDFETFDVTASADLTEEHPKVFKSVDVVYHVNGSAPDLAKIQKAVDMSLTKYCGVSAMISKTCPINYKIEINGQTQAQGQAKF